MSKSLCWLVRHPTSIASVIFGTWLLGVCFCKKKKKGRNWAEINHDVEDWISHVLHTYQYALPRRCSWYGIKKVKLRGIWHNHWSLCEATTLCLRFYPRGRMGTKNGLGPDWLTTQSVVTTYKYTILITYTKPNKLVLRAWQTKIFICSGTFFQQLLVHHIWHPPSPPSN